MLSTQRWEPAGDAAIGADAPEPPPTWRWKHADKPIKVVVLAGSIGAWPRKPYARRFADMCANVEVKNLSKVGFGAWALKKRFQQQVLENNYLGLRRKVEGRELWLVFQGGLNSVGTPEQTNHHIRSLFTMAHKRNFKVVALSLTPWGDDEDKRWRGIRGLKFKRATTIVVDFVLGALSPAEALGSHAKRRKVEADAPWDPSELPDVAVDLYRSTRLRHVEAEPRPLEDMKKELQRDRLWKRAHAELSDAEREAALEKDAREASELPRWYLRQELRSFDHIHPNTEGHRLLASEVCPSLPASWGCSCPELPPAPAAPEAAGSATGQGASPAGDASPDALLLGTSYSEWGWLLLRALIGASP